MILVTVSLDKRGWGLRTVLYQSTLKGKTHFLTSKGGKIKKIPIEKLMKPFTVLNPSHRQMIYSIWCLDIDQSIEATTMLKNYVTSEAIRIKEEWEPVAKHLPECTNFEYGNCSDHHSNGTVPCDHCTKIEFKTLTEDLSIHEPNPHKP